MQCYALGASPFEGNTMRTLLLILFAVFVGAATAAQAQPVIDAEGQKATGPQVRGQAQGQAQDQAQDQAPDQVQDKGQDKEQAKAQDPGLAQPQVPQPPSQMEGNAHPPLSSRYSFSRVENGLLRLDNETGQVAYCSARGAGWGCTAVDMDSAATETEAARLQKQIALLNNLNEEMTRLHEEVTSLKQEIALLKEPPPPRPPADLTPLPNKESDVSVKLPTQQDLARARDFLEDAWRRLVEMIANIQKDIMRKG
jgi:hypothetical protein